MTPEQSRGRSEKIVIGSFGRDAILSNSIRLTQREVRDLKRIKTLQAHAAEHGIKLDNFAELQAFTNRHPVLILLLAANESLNKTRESLAQLRTLDARIAMLESIEDGSDAD